MRIYEPVGCTEAAADNVVGPDLRRQAAHIIGLQKLNRFQARFHLALVVLAQIFQMALVCGGKKIALRPVAGGISHDFVERAEERDRVKRHPDVDGGGELSPHAAHALSGGTFTLVRFALDHQDVAASGLGQVVSDARTDDSTADDDDVRRLHLRLLACMLALSCTGGICVCSSFFKACSWS